MVRHPLARNPLCALLGALLGLGALGACSPSPTDLLHPVKAVGTAAAPLSSQAPDAEMLQLAAAAVGCAARLAEHLPKLGLLVSGYRRSLAAHPPPTPFQLAQSEDSWPFRFGWHRLKLGDQGDQLLARFELEDRTPVAFDLLKDSNYSPDLHPHVPANVAHLRVEGAFQLGALGQLAVRATAPIGALGTRLELSGSGSLAAPAPLGAANLQALALVLGPDDRIESGTLVMQSIGGGAIRQVSGELGPQGLKPGATLLANGSQAGRLGGQDGRWVAEGGGQRLALPTDESPAP